MLTSQKSLYFPAIEGTSLASKSTKSTVDILPGKVSLIAMLNTKISVVSCA